MNSNEAQQALSGIFCKVINYLKCRPVCMLDGILLPV